MDPPLTNFNPTPFPASLPTISLKKISLSKLLNDDEAESRRMFDVCTNEGFFYLDLTGEPKGQKFLRELHDVRQEAEGIFTGTTMEVWNTWEARKGEGHVSSGYKRAATNEKGGAEILEVFNVAHSDLGDTTTPFQLPSCLSDHTPLFRSTIRSGHNIASIILGALEKCIQLPSSSLTSLHRLSETSGDFLNVLRYPAPPAERHGTVNFPPHRDANSITILFTWLGGLQVPESDAEAVDEDNWRFVEPLPDHAIVNLGEALQALTNGVLKAGKHRVVAPPGNQVNFDKYSVIVSTRPTDDTIMRCLQSPLIPPETEEQISEGNFTIKQWTIRKAMRVMGATHKA
ncbi:hypothetical protein GP486_007786 [Trichoglossum hirsutum]|uniref:Fe2OG dioxygenase domain-containing protein n=1 Tax=Trichoglossum hirsutum TaxID=265104 RepID=A0A9P8IJ88_9PEZI|nr:hypothetical protein GP486_007786 [Trichoglossum hirsutum]